MTLDKLVDGWTKFSIATFAVAAIVGVVWLACRLIVGGRTRAMRKWRAAVLTYNLRLELQERGYHFDRANAIARRKYNPGYQHGREMDRVSLVGERRANRLRERWDWE